MATSLHGSSELSSCSDTPSSTRSLYPAVTELKTAEFPPLPSGALESLAVAVRFPEALGKSRFVLEGSVESGR